MIADLAAGMTDDERITFFAECCIQQALQRYARGDIAAWLYGHAQASLEHMMRQYVLEMSCRVIGLEAELKRCRNKTGEYEQS